MWVGKSGRGNAAKQTSQNSRGPLGPAETDEPPAAALSYPMRPEA